MMALSLAYVIYLRRARLTKHIALDKPRVAGLTATGKPRWVAVHIVMTWMLFAALLMQMASGLLLYLGNGGMVVTVHYYGALALLAYPFAHVAVHAAIGGIPQLLRIFRPSPMAQTEAPENFTGILLDAYLKQGAELDALRGKPKPAFNAKPPVKSGTFSSSGAAQAHPAAIAAGAALAFSAIALPLDWSSKDTLDIARVENAELPTIDGELSDPVWQVRDPVVVATMQGVNFTGGSGTSNVDIRAVHDGKYVYFAFTWDDPTRSLKHLPLIKKEDGWHLLHEQYDIEDEDNYYEDKFGVMFSHAHEPGGGTTHIGEKPLAGMPAAYSKRGLHYTTDGGIVDVWHWKAARGGLLGAVDDNFFGEPAKPKPEEVAGKKRYKAGYAADPGGDYYKNNFKGEGPGGYVGPIKPEKLPKDVAAVTAALGRVDTNPAIGEDENAKWWMMEAKTAPYSAAHDAKIPVGTIIPGVIVTSQAKGDRGDVKGAARWAAGRWTLEAVRLLDTGQKKDLKLESGMALWVSPFDHSQTRHTRHMRPVTMEIGQ
jgi:hypothetical protein